MRILLTRPKAASLGFARLLEAAGHQAVICPVIEVVATGAAIPDGRFDGLIASSAHVFDCLQAPDATLAQLATLPLYVVGERTSKAAQKKGFANLQHAEADSVQLARSILSKTSAPQRLLYLAGEDRKPMLESLLEQAGHKLTAVVIYRAVAGPGLPDDVQSALRDRKIEAVLHFSRRSAMLFAQFVEAAGLIQAVQQLHHVCFSQDVAAGLAGIGTAKVVVAAAQEPDAMVAALEKIAD